ncbi:hypothetical protein DL766_000175 [Monosporascus sp. MC13-8B]|uniref:Malonyl-CoA:ACP transacylase (MAT) domain-containing protein n=1 Tax=Monosporascus cannonballus TaxID=155416 RepID=A0ABY0HG96_9PEZI|nr:hypothetical protein DL762_001623 [Monosporascus cannonballus]RYP01541.1 hypothetical protein DL763_000072 [Monosporascus cannonballus]RYP39966.1 hypothetical protein DL766_000175 [Monosporascus sp. MC13-8B]
MPGAASQSALIRDACSRFGLYYTNPSERCQYFEANRAGAAAGDSIEVDAIHRAFSGILRESRPTAQSLGRQQTPSSHDRLEVPVQAIPWPATEEGNVRRVSVNSFGFGSTNAHAIVEQYPSSTTTQDKALNGDSLSTPLMFSVSFESSLAASVEAFAAMLDDTSNGKFATMKDITATLQSRRSNLPVKFAVTGPKGQRIAAKLQMVLEAPQPGLGVRPKFIQGVKSKVCVPPLDRERNGHPWEPICSNPVPHSARLEGPGDLPAELPSPSKRSLTKKLAKPSATSRVSEAEISQPLCTTVQVALVDVLPESGITFDRVIGHSSGEIWAAYAAGFITARGAIRIAYLCGTSAKFARTDDDGGGGSGGNGCRRAFV